MLTFEKLLSTIECTPVALPYTLETTCCHLSLWAALGLKLLDERFRSLVLPVSTPVALPYTLETTCCYLSLWVALGLKLRNERFSIA